MLLGEIENLDLDAAPGEGGDEGWLQVCLNSGWIGVW